VPDWIDQIRGELDRVVTQWPSPDEALTGRWSMAEGAPLGDEPAPATSTVRSAHPSAPSNGTKSAKSGKRPSKSLSA
jgi:hypothetical protein